MAKNVKKFVSREFARTVDLDLLRRLLQPYAGQLLFDWNGLPVGVRERREALFEFFRTADERFPPQLLDALHCILVLSNPNGVRILRDCAEQAGVALIPDEEIGGETDGRHLTPRHIALRAYLDHRAIFDRALDLHAFIAAASPTEFSGAREDVPSRHEDPAAREAFRRAASAYFAGRYLGRYCDVRWYPDDEEINILVLHGKNVVTANVEQDGEERTLTFREIAQDTIRYHPPSGRVKTSAQYPSERRMLADLFAEHMLGEPGFFDGEGSQRLYTLAPVQRAGRDFRFRTEWDEDVEGVVIREIQVDEGEQEEAGRRRYSPWATTVRDNRNAIVRLLELAPDIDLADLHINYIKVEFRFRLNDKTRRILVKIKPPGTVSFRDHAMEARIMEHLRRNGICLPRPVAAAAAAAE